MSDSDGAGQLGRKHQTDEDQERKLLPSVRIVAWTDRDGVSEEGGGPFRVGRLWDWSPEVIEHRDGCSACVSFNDYGRTDRGGADLGSPLSEFGVLRATKDLVVDRIWGHVVD